MLARRIRRKTTDETPPACGSTLTCRSMNRVAGRMRVLEMLALVVVIGIAGLPAISWASGLVCPGGSDSRTGDIGNCWSCPAGYVSYLDDFDSPKACIKRGSCPTGTSRLVEDCVSCPDGSTLDLGRELETACSKPSSIKETVFASPTVLQSQCPSGTFQVANDCLSCPDGYTYTRDGDSECSKQIASDYEFEYRGPTVRQTQNGSCPSGSTLFIDECWSCPAGYTKNAPGDPDSFCSKPSGMMETVYTEPTVLPAQCPSGTFQVANDCLSCPDGYRRYSNTECSKQIATENEVDYSPAIVHPAPNVYAARTSTPGTWNLTIDPLRYYRLTAPAVAHYNGKSVTAATKGSSPTMQPTTTNSDAQLWRFEPAGDGNYRMIAKSMEGKGLTVDVSGTKAIITDVSGSASRHGQRMTLVPNNTLRRFHIYPRSRGAEQMIGMGHGTVVVHTKASQEGSYDWNTLKYYWQLEPVDYVSDLKFANVNVSSWMTQLSEFRAFAHKNLAEILIPGTHDSGSYSWHNTPAARNQTADIAGQVRGGIRYFDLRPWYDNRSGGYWEPGWYWHHSVAVSTDQKMVPDLKALRDFAASHPKEILILDITRPVARCTAGNGICKDGHEGLTAKQQTAWEKIMTDTFKNQLIPRGASLTLEDIWASGKNVLIMRDQWTSDIWSVFHRGKAIYWGIKPILNADFKRWMEGRLKTPHAATFEGTDWIFHRADLLRYSWLSIRNSAKTLNLDLIKWLPTWAKNSAMRPQMNVLSVDFFDNVRFVYTVVTMNAAEVAGSL